jgi:signal transduction histidine kinase
LSLALEKQEALRKRLFSDVAHDLRTPVTILISHLEAIRDGIWKPDAERLTVCMEEANQLARLISEVEKLARLDVGETILHPVKGDLMPVVRQVTAGWFPIFAAKHVEIRQTGTSAVGFFDQEGLFTILNNLLGNALRHTPDGGAVTVDTCMSEGHARLSVTDTGIGIPASDLPHIFERFYRADNSRSSETGGSGIGLAIVRALLDAQGGTIRVQSALGTGTVFTVDFPLSGEEHRNG